MQMILGVVIIVNSESSSTMDCCPFASYTPSDLSMLEVSYLFAVVYVNPSNMGPRCTN